MAKKFISYSAMIFVVLFVILVLIIPVTAQSAKFDKVVVIDAGHGLPDAGAVGINTNVQESEINLAIAKYLAKLCIEHGIKPVMTRTSSDNISGVAKFVKRLDMLKRQEIILNAVPDLVISIHLNKFSNSTVAGARVFFKNGDEWGRQLAVSLQSNLNKINERDLVAQKGDYYILNCSDYPSAIAECGFLSNPSEEQKLMTESYQRQIAQCLLEGIVEFFVNN